MGQRGKEGLLLLAVCALFCPSNTQLIQPIQATLSGGIETVASSATNFLANAVERPRNLLINATRATTGIIDSAASKGLEFKLRRFLEKFRSRMRYGIPELGIPVLEPLHLDEVVITSDNPEIGELNVVLNDLTISKLSTFVIDKAKLSLVGPSITVNLTFPEIFASGYYNISGILGNMFPLHGAGPFEAAIYDFRLYINIVIGFSRGLYVKSLDLDFSLGAADIHMENFMGGDKVGEVMNQVFQELTPEALDIIKPDILPVIQDYVTNMANEAIRHLTMRDLFTLLLGQNEIRDIAHLLIP
ncbi:hypothetical protein KM043_012914 [Ampulex compressa]|nr:hypothetical protein KM043_012914 [Ampulex compressa]